MKDKVIYVYTDGGYRPYHKLGAYSFCVSKGKRCMPQKGLIYNCDSVDTAEFTAMIKGFSFIKKDIPLLRKRGYKIVFVTDSMRLTHVFNDLLKVNNKLFREIRKISQKYSDIVRVVWVKRNSLVEQKMCHDMCDMVLDNKIKTVKQKLNSLYGARRFYE